MAGITSLGVGSGLDLAKLVDDLIVAEGEATTLRLDTQEAATKTDLSAYGTVSGALTTFNNTIKNFNTPDKFQVKSVSVSDSTKFSITADKTASAGSLNITVEQLAVADQYISLTETDSATDIGGGTLTISVGSDSFDIEIAAGASSLEEIKTAINSASDNTGVSASVITSDAGAQLVLTSKGVGTANAITITVDDDDETDADQSGLSRLATANQSNIVPAEDAIITIAGQTITRTDSNVFDDALTGVSISIFAETSQTESFTIATDNTSVVQLANDFVTAFNNLTAAIKSVSSFDAENNEADPLLGDALVRNLQSQLNRIVGATVDGQAEGFDSLSAVGITFNEAGNLVVDTSRFNNALLSNFNSVGDLFAKSSEGVIPQFQKVVNTFTNKATGLIPNKVTSLNEALSDIADDKSVLEQRLQTLEQNLVERFTNLDILINQLNQTSSFLTQQFESIAKIGQQK